MLRDATAMTNLAAATLLLSFDAFCNVQYEVLIGFFSRLCILAMGFVEYKTQNQIACNWLPLFSLGRIYAH